MPMLRIAIRVFAAVILGYWCTSEVVGFLAVTVPRLTTIPRPEAVRLSEMLGFLVYLTVLILAFADPRLWRVCTVLVGLGLACQGAVAWMVTTAAAR
jgi:hypothetical protein